jgi:hypothetical protein
MLPTLPIRYLDCMPVGWPNSKTLIVSGNLGVGLRFVK